MKIITNNINSKPNFKGPLDGVLTNVLRTCDMNAAVNAVGLDIGAMVLPRTYYDTKARNKYAGMETFIREISGTFINCLSAGIFATIVSKIANKTIMSDVHTGKTNWCSDEAVNTLNTIWQDNNTAEEYSKKFFENLKGHDGKQINKFSEIKTEKIDWINEEKWQKFKWDNKNYENIAEKMKTKEGLQNTLAQIIKDEKITKNDKQNVLKIMNSRLVNILGVEREITLNYKNKSYSGTAERLLNDALNMGKEIFNNPHVNTEAALKKISRVNKIKTFDAVILSGMLGLTNQLINRKMTEKRTGIKGFVGDVDYTDENRKKQTKEKGLLLKKIIASLGMAGLVISVMRVKNFKDFAHKLEITGPIADGNVIKTVYATNIIGRFMAADNSTELRESVTRDYFGFLNWLVLGGFVAKGVANLFDKKGDTLFNYTKKGKGLKHWLNDMTLKTHKEIAAKGKDFAKANMWKINIAQAAGIAYSAITLGLLLPMFNAKLTQYRAKKAVEKRTV